MAAASLASVRAEAILVSATVVLSDSPRREAVEEGEKVCVTKESYWQTRRRHLTSRWSGRQGLRPAAAQLPGVRGQGRELEPFVVSALVGEISNLSFWRWAGHFGP